MENCTIYSHYLDFDKVVQIVTETLPKAKIEFNDGGMQKSLVARIKGGFFGKTKTLKINYRQRANPSYKLDQIDCGLTQNLSGMVNYIQTFPAQNIEVKDKFLHKIMAANCEIPFIAEPEINKEFEEVLRKVILELDAFVFASPSQLFSKSDGQHFLDKGLHLILDGSGKCEIKDIDVNVEAKYHDGESIAYSEEQSDRKAKSESFLDAHAIKVNKNLPCSPSSEDVELRLKDEVLNRAYALLIIAVKGEGLEQEQLEKVVLDKRITSFSPREKVVFDSTELSDQERAYATWRYESLYTMMWALGKMDDLKFPSDICDVQEIVGKIFQLSREEFVETVQLRSKSEILDELDKTYRMNWACVDARIKGEEVSGGINPSVIYERHYSLNWLTKYQDQDWDDVQTNT